MTSRPTAWATAALLHGYSWDAGAVGIALSGGLTVGPMSDSAVGHLYQDLCRRDGLDDGDPLGFEVYIATRPLVGEQHQGMLFGCGDPHSVIESAVNAMCIALGTPPTVVRIIASTDGFQSAHHTEILSDLAHSIEALSSLTWPPVTVDAIATAERVWLTTRRFSAAPRTGSRLLLAVTYFYYAWRSYYLDQVCLNLVVTLEALFSPPNAGETTHQLAFNVARYLHSDRSQQEETYDAVKRLYSVRSDVVHGRPPSERKLYDYTVAAFPLVAGLLRRVLASDEESSRFNDEASRRQLLKDLLFR